MPCAPSTTGARVIPIVDTGLPGHQRSISNRGPRLSRVDQGGDQLRRQAGRSGSGSAVPLARVTVGKTIDMARKRL